jgi:hypothetical protein
MQQIASRYPVVLRSEFFVPLWGLSVRDLDIFQIFRFSIGWSQQAAVLGQRFPFRSPFVGQNAIDWDIEFMFCKYHDRNLTFARDRQPKRIEGQCFSCSSI